MTIENIRKAVEERTGYPAELELVGGVYHWVKPRDWIQAPHPVSSFDTVVTEFDTLLVGEAAFVADFEARLRASNFIASLNGMWKNFCKLEGMTANDR